MKTRGWIYMAIFASVAMISACDDDDDERSLNTTDSFEQKPALT